MAKRRRKKIEHPEWWGPPRIFPTGKPEPFVLDMHTLLTTVVKLADQRPHDGVGFHMIRSQFLRQPQHQQMSEVIQQAVKFGNLTWVGNGWRPTDNCRAMLEEMENNACKI